MLRLKKEQVAQMEAHARQEYPRECCGVLVGRKDGDKEVLEVHPSRNLRRGAYEYEIEPKKLLEAFRRADKKSLEVIGFYHSHPNIAPYPSQIDSSTAWVGFSYVIVSISLGGCEIKSWLWDEEKSRFEEEKVVVE